MDEGDSRCGSLLAQFACFEFGSRVVLLATGAYSSKAVSSFHMQIATKTLRRALAELRFQFHTFLAGLLCHMATARVRHLLELSWLKESTRTEVVINHLSVAEPKNLSRFLHSRG